MTAPAPLLGPFSSQLTSSGSKRGTQDRAQAFSCMMNPYHIVEYSIHIAWDYLEATGELGDPEEASQVLLSEIQRMVRRGETAR